MKAPFPWFGGKRRVAFEVWSALGDVDNYSEPFAGSLAVLLERPAWHTGATETVNDADAHLANFWRALQADPDAVARWADWPVNEVDLIARHLWLVNTGRERVAALESDPEHFDAQAAGWWVWGLCAWIGSGWCSGTGPHTAETISGGTPGQGVNRKLPHLGTPGQGVNRKLPHLGTPGQGVNRKLPHLGDPGRGVNRQLPHLGNPGRGDAPNLAYFRALATRLRRVRVCCGDWSRVVTSGALSYGATVGVFLDPPYLADVRTADLYATDSDDVAHAVREWAIAHGDDPRLRIVLAGYEGEHAELMPPTWRKHAYSGTSAYCSATSGSANSQNRHNERLWFSPHCLVVQPSLFDQTEESPYRAGCVVEALDREEGR